MSDELRQALRTMKEVHEADASRGMPVTYLHDPKTLEPFAALVSLDLLEQIEGWDPMAHSHREGDEDEPIDRGRRRG